MFTTAHCCYESQIVVRPIIINWVEVLRPTRHKINWNQLAGSVQLWQCKQAFTVCQTRLALTWITVCGTSSQQWHARSIFHHHLTSSWSSIRNVCHEQSTAAFFTVWLVASEVTATKHEKRTPRLFVTNTLACRWSLANDRTQVSGHWSATWHKLTRSDLCPSLCYSLLVPSSPPQQWNPRTTLTSCWTFASLSQLTATSHNSSTVNAATHTLHRNK